jgi:hypothetical protein
LEGDIVIFDGFVGAWLRVEGVRTVLCDDDVCDQTNDLCPDPGGGGPPLDKREITTRANGDEFSYIRDPGPGNLVIRRPEEGLGIDIQQGSSTIRYSTRTLSGSGNISPPNNGLDGLTWRSMDLLAQCFGAGGFLCPQCPFSGALFTAGWKPERDPQYSRSDFIRENNVVKIDTRFRIDMAGTVDEFDFQQATTLCPAVLLLSGTYSVQMRQCFSDSDLERLDAINPEGNVNSVTIGSGMMHCSRIGGPQDDVSLCGTFYIDPDVSNNLFSSSNCITWYGEIQEDCVATFDYSTCYGHLQASYLPQCKFGTFGGCFSGSTASSDLFSSY